MDIISLKTNKCSDYEHYPRVTQILSATKPREEIKRLQKRKESDTDGTLAARDSQRSDEGSLIHQLGCDYLKSDRTTEPEAPEQLLTYWTPFKEFLDQMGGEPAGLEIPVLNHTLKYRGTPDARLYFPGTDTHVLLDFKTFEGYTIQWSGERQSTWPVWRACKNMPPEEERGFEWLHYRARDAFCQCCLYRLALIEMGMPVDEIWIAVVTRDAGVQLLQLKPEWWADCKAQAVDRVREYHRLFPLANEYDDVPF
jgi:hypothetical protein